VVGHVLPGGGLPFGYRSIVHRPTHLELSQSLVQFMLFAGHDGDVCSFFDEQRG